MNTEIIPGTFMNFDSLPGAKKASWKLCKILLLLITLQTPSESETSISKQSELWWEGESYQLMIVNLHILSLNKPPDENYTSVTVTAKCDNTTSNQQCVNNDHCATTLYSSSGRMWSDCEYASFSLFHTIDISCRLRFNKNS